MNLTKSDLFEFYHYVDVLVKYVKLLSEQLGYLHTNLTDKVMESTQEEEHFENPFD